MEFTVKQLLNQVQVLPDTDCWEFRGNRSADGYGRMYSDNKELKAHRVFYEICEGPIPDGMYLQHHLPADLCIGHACCNPDHLRVSNSPCSPPYRPAQDVPKRPPDDSGEHRDRATQWSPQGQVPSLPAGILAEELSPKGGKGAPHLSAERSTAPHRGGSSFR